MLKNLMCLVSFVLAAFMAMPVEARVKAPTLENLRINGMLMYDNDRSEDVLGFYEYTATSPVERRLLTPSTRNYLSGDAVVVDGKLYTYHLDVQYGYVNSAFYSVIDVATGIAEKGANVSWELGPAYSHYATSAALNPKDGKVYCSGYEYNEADKTLAPTLKIWNVAENSKEAVGSMAAALAVMSFDAQGNLYGITSSSSKTADDGGRLVKVDIATGALTMVGDTGVRPQFDQSGVISPYDGRLYWFANEPVPGGSANDAYARLYAVDLSTAEAECIGDLPNGDEVVAAWIPAQTVDDAAPGVVSGLSAEFTAPSLSGKVLFSLPSKSYSGAMLEGDVDWSVTAGGKVLAGGSGAAGSAVEAPVAVDESGEYVFEVAAGNASGKGVAVQTACYVGYGMPTAVGEVNFAVEDGRHVVAWEHVTTLAKGHYLDGGRASYRVVRQPGNVLLHENLAENRFEEPALDGAIQSTYYEITAVNGDRHAAATKSNVVVTGSCVALPFEENFDDASALSLFSIVDANEDRTTWSYYSYSKVVQIRQVSSGTHDDWLVLPRAELQEGYSYELKFNCYATNVSYVNVLDVAMGATPDNMSETIASDIEVTGAKSSAMKEVSVLVKPKTTGVYNIGIHIKSASRQGTFAIKNILLSAGKSTAVPGAPGLNVSAAAKGALKAELSICAPTHTAGGAELVKPVESFDIERDGVAVATVAAEAGKTEYVFEDNGITTSGIYTYSVCAINADGRGEKSEATVYVGRDMPKAPVGFGATDNFDGTVTLSWEEPSGEGINGGYVDVEHLVYTLTNPDKSVTEGLKGTSTKAAIDKSGEQREIRYLLGVKYDDDASAKAQTAESNALVAGAPYRLPFAENFADAAFASAVWTKDPIQPAKTTDFNFMTGTDADHGGNGGGLKIFAYENNSAGRWISPVIDLSGNENPEITFWVNMLGTVDFELQVQEAYGEWTTLTSSGPVSAWTEVNASLADFRSPFVRLGFLARFAKGYSSLYIDDIDIREHSSGIEGIMAGEDDVELYNLQGLRVSEAREPGVYIVRKGSVARKMIVR